MSKKKPNSSQTAKKHKKKSSLSHKKPAKAKQISTSKAHTTPKRRTLPPELVGLCTLLTALLLLIALITYRRGSMATNWLGLVGYSVSWGLTYLFGIGAFLAVGFSGWLGWRALISRPVGPLWAKLPLFLLLLSTLCLSFSALAEIAPGVAGWFDSHIPVQTIEEVHRGHYTQSLRHNLGGIPYYYLFRDLPTYNMQHLLSNIGTLLVSCTAGAAAFLLLAEIRIGKLVRNWIERRTERKERGSALRNWLERRRERKIAMAEALPTEFEPTMRTTAPAPTRVKEPLPSNLPPDLPKTEVKLPAPPPRKSEPLPPPPTPVQSGGNYPHFDLPSCELLSQPKRPDQSALKKQLLRQAALLEETLRSFGIEAKVGEIHCGPTIIAMEVHPAIGVKVQKIKALESDIALNLEAKAIRIIAPIPGKAAVGVEIPSPQPQEVSFREMLESYQRSGSNYRIPLLLGKTVTGEEITTDLTKMPHAIIAGATGSGKSVCLNTIILSILHTRRPDEVRLLMVDPKKVELTGYSKVPHMIAPVITEPEEACCALNWLVKEMERRYELLKAVGVRNIDAFNSRERNLEEEAALEIEVPEKLCYMVGIVDELADLMMVASSDIETPITRIAQMARAVGIHLLLATQRPSREVITGLIKANFPTRIAFKVANRINSQIILDEPGAEQLLGNGDMLFLPPGTSQIVRAQGAFIRDSNINKVVRHLCEQAPTDYLIESFRDQGLESGHGGGSGELDSLYDQAVELVVSTGSASTTFLQRKMKVGYARAASIMDQLEANSVVGPQEGSKPRKVLVRGFSYEE